MVYDPKKAIAFASNFWDRPCRSDKNPEGALGLDEARDVPVGHYWNKRKVSPDNFDKFELRFVYNEKTDRDDLLAVAKAGSLAPVLVVDGEKLEDCAHFLSQCLEAGGLRIEEQWSVPMLLMKLREKEDSPNPIAKTLAEKVSRDAAQNVIDSGLLKIGDMIGYFFNGGFAHSAMFTGKLTKADDKGHVTCHTKSRFMGKTPKGVPDEWFLSNPDYKFTLVHIPDDSEAHPPPLGAKLAGWWKVVNKATTEFYYIKDDGTGIRTANAPKDAKPPRPGAGDGRGYWFASPTEAKFCWRADGSVVTMKPSQDGKSAQVFVTRSGPATATRLDFDSPKKQSR
jgi:hypothetical protein